MEACKEFVHGGLTVRVSECDESLASTGHKGNAKGNGNQRAHLEDFAEGTEGIEGMKERVSILGNGKAFMRTSHDEEEEVNA